MSTRPQSCPDDARGGSKIWSGYRPKISDLHDDGNHWGPHLPDIQCATKNAPMSLELVCYMAISGEEKEM